MSIAYSSIPTRRFRIDGNGNHEKLLEELKFLIDDKSINPADFKIAKLSYNAKKGLGSYNSETYWPLKFIADDKELWVSSVETGLHDNSRIVLKVLHIMGFKFGKKVKQIVLFQKTVDTVFKKQPLAV